MTKSYIKRLRKLPKNFQDVFIDVISKIERGEINELDIIKLQGTENSYRCRLGKFRIIFHKDISGSCIIDAIGSRGDIYKH